MAYAWEGVLKSPMTLVREELTRRYIKYRDAGDNLVNYVILIDTDEDQPDLAVGVQYRNNSLLFMVDLMIDCPDDIEVIANVAEIAYEMYSREEPYYGRLLVKDGRTYYQLIHFLGTGHLDSAMVSMLLDMVTNEVMEVVDERYAIG